MNSGDTAGTSGMTSTVCRNEPKYFYFLVNWVKIGPQMIENATMERIFVCFVIILCLKMAKIEIFPVKRQIITTKLNLEKIIPIHRTIPLE